MIVKLYSKFAKRNNSTKTPTGGVEYTGTLKDNCDILNPVVIFQAAGAVDYFPASYNYAYIDAFERYYFITCLLYTSPSPRD